MTTKAMDETTTGAFRGLAAAVHALRAMAAREESETYGQYLLLIAADDLEKIALNVEAVKHVAAGGYYKADRQPDSSRDEWLRNHPEDNIR